VPLRKAGRRVVLFVVLTAIAAGAAASYVGIAASRAQAQRSAQTSGAAGVRVEDGARLLFLRSQGDAFRRVAWSGADVADADPRVSELQCQRIYFAAGRGLCAGTTFTGGAFIFDRDLRATQQLAASGLASRARISADGRYGAMTFFVRGDSYADAGFSTRTTIVRMADGSEVGDLETFAVLKDGAPYRSVDFNFWGVSFMPDSNRFYATLGTRTETFLVRGDVSAKRLEVVRSNVECPSVSPDGSRLVFKKRMPDTRPGAVTWHLALLDLSTLKETMLADDRSVDDQAEWLDNDRIVYSLPDAGPPATIRPDIWTLDLRGGASTRIGTEAMSPAVVR
jgi:hypothetical protein